MISKFASYNFSNQKTLVRVDFNVPLDENNIIVDDTRIQASILTIQKIIADGGSVILMSHLGRPKDGPNKKYSLTHILCHLKSLLNKKEILFADDCIGQSAIQQSKSLQPGQVLLLENVRFYKEEEKGDIAFAKKLSALGDVYVNDAFGTAHRAHASTAIIAQFFPKEKKMFGLLMENEIENAKKILHDAQSPFTAIIGGAKVSDKILIIENLLKKANHIIIGGGMAYTFIKAESGNIGKSLCEDDKTETAKYLLQIAKQKSVTIHLPVDSVIANQFSANAKTKTSNSHNIDKDWMGLDIGPKACEQFSAVIKKSKTILWNGPMGVFEMKPFENGTKSVANALAQATQQGAFSLIGGGDSVAAIHQFKLADQVSYISTGGGAMLEYFEGKILPGIAAIES